MSVFNILQDSKRYQVYQKGRTEISYGYYPTPDKARERLNEIRKDLPDYDFGIYDIMRGEDIS